MHPWNRSVEETKDVFHQCGWTNVCSDLQVSDPAPESVIKCKYFGLHHHTIISTV